MVYPLYNALLTSKTTTHRSPSCCTRNSARVLDEDCCYSSKKNISKARKLLIDYNIITHFVRAHGERLPQIMGVSQCRHVDCMRRDIKQRANYTTHTINTSTKQTNK